MAKLLRFGVSAEEDLVKEFDEIIKAAGYTNRSEALRDLMREFVLERKAHQEGNITIGTITVLYDHKKRKLANRLVDYQHLHNECITATMHIHVDKRLCMEVLAVKGEISKIREIASHIGSEKGVFLSKLTIAKFWKEDRK